MPEFEVKGKTEDGRRLSEMVRGNDDGATSHSVKAFQLGIVDNAKKENYPREA